MSRSPRLLLVLASVAFVGLVVACTGGTVKVGAVLPLEGKFALYGEPINQGIQLAYELYQAAGEGSTIELEVRDSRSDPQRAADQLEELYRAGAVAVIGGVTTDEALEMVPVADGANRVLLSPSASSPRLTGISRNFFRIYPSDFREGNKMGNFAAQDLGIDQIVILGAESPYAKGIQDVFQSEYERFGGEVLAVIEYEPDQLDFSDEVERALALDPVGIYVADYAQNVSRIISALREDDFDGKILTTSAYATPETIATAGGDAEGVLLTQTAVPADDPNLQAFNAAYQERYGERPNIWAAHGFDAFNVMARAINETNAMSADDVWKGLRGIHNYQGASGVIQFDERGDVGKFPRTFVIEGGELVDYERAVEDKRQEILRRIEELNRTRSQLQRDEG